RILRCVRVVTAGVQQATVVPDLPRLERAPPALGRAARGGTCATIDRPRLDRASDRGSHSLDQPGRCRRSAREVRDCAGIELTTRESNGKPWTVFVSIPSFQHWWLPST